MLNRPSVLVLSAFRAAGVFGSMAWLYRLCHDLSAGQKQLPNCGRRRSNYDASNIDSLPVEASER